MPAGNFSVGFHPAAHLAVYALDALDNGEARQVEAHLSGCARCRRTYMELQGAASLLGESVEHRAPPPSLASRVMAAVSQAAVPNTLVVGYTARAGRKNQVARFLLPAAAAVVVALFVVGVVMTERLSGRVEVLERENSTLTAQIAESADESAQVTERVRILQSASYWLADPSYQPLKLESPGGVSSSRGVLVLNSNGSRAMLMVSGMRDQALSTTYQIWLTRQGDRVWAGKLDVDGRGWGTSWFQPGESLYEFEKVELTGVAAAISEPETQTMVLEGKILVPPPPQTPFLR